MAAARRRHRSGERLRLPGPDHQHGGRAARRARARSSWPTGSSLRVGPHAGRVRRRRHRGRRHHRGARRAPEARTRDGRRGHRDRRVRGHRRHPRARPTGELESARGLRLRRRRRLVALRSHHADAGRLRHRRRLPRARAARSTRPSSSPCFSAPCMGLSDQHAARADVRVVQGRRERLLLRARAACASASSPAPGCGAQVHHARPSVHRLPRHRRRREPRRRREQVFAEHGLAETRCSRPRCDSTTRSRRSAR